VVIGAGHNGLVAATLLARAGWSVELLERSPVAGGAVGSDLTDRGYLHDWGSAYYGVLHTSPVLTELGLDRRVEWAHTGTPVAAIRLAPLRWMRCCSRLKLVRSPSKATTSPSSTASVGPSLNASCNAATTSG